MKTIDLGGGWYVNPSIITHIRPIRDKHDRPHDAHGHDFKSEIHFAMEKYLFCYKTPEEIMALIASADTDLESAVKNLIDASVKNEALLAMANDRVRELTDRLALFEVELKALREISLPTAQCAKESVK